jgi:hypothetical protein
MANTRKAKGTAAAVDDEEIFDLGAIEGGRPFPFKHRNGRRFVFCDLGDIDINVAKAADAGNLDAIKLAMRYGLGDVEDSSGRDVDATARAEWVAFEGIGLSLREATALFERWAKHSGLTQGE